MTIYNLFAKVIPQMAARQGVQSVFDVNMGMPSVMGWYQVGMDVQQGQNLTLNELGKGLVLVAVGCNRYAKDKRADMLKVMPADEVAPMFRQRAAQMLGTEDVTYIQDLGALEYGKVGLVAVPSCALSELMGVEPAVEDGVEPGVEQETVETAAMEPRRNEGLAPVSGSSESDDIDDDTHEPPTLSAPASTHTPAASYEEPSLFDDSDFEAFIADDRKRNAPGCVDRMLMQLAIHGKEERCYMAYSLWSGKMESTYDPSTLMKIYILGICLLTGIGYFPCIALIDAGCREFWMIISPIVAMWLVWTGVMIWVNYRVGQLKAAME